MSATNALMSAVPQRGRVEWIGVAPKPQAAVQVVDAVEAEVGSGLAGDHHATSGLASKRQVTLIQAEHFPVVASLCGLSIVEPHLLRRNICVSGINLLSLKKRRFRIGTAELEGTGPCAPCS
ncbi:MAG: MOSC domain-containing protein, partial [Planctomycetaceae bacterium]|nr:MOSC domain-containing protein [Planctomycetaceae bacterium]